MLTLSYCISCAIVKHIPDSMVVVMLGFLDLAIVITIFVH